VSSVLCHHWWRRLPCQLWGPIICCHVAPWRREKKACPTLLLHGFPLLNNLAFPDDLILNRKIATLQGVRWGSSSIPAIVDNAGLRDVGFPIVDMPMPCGGERGGHPTLVFSCFSFVNDFSASPVMYCYITRLMVYMSFKFKTLPIVDHWYHGTAGCDIGVWKYESLITLSICLGTCGMQDCWTAGSWDCRIAGLWDCRTAGSWDCGTVGSQDRRTTGLRNCGIARLQDYRVCGVTNMWDYDFSCSFVVFSFTCWALQG